MGKLNVKYLVLGDVSTNVYLAQNTDTGEVLIVDPADEPDRIRTAVEEMGGKAAAILLTHGHHDHILVADALGASYQVPVIAHEEEEALLGDPALNLSQSHGFFAQAHADRLVKEGEELDLAGFAIRVLHTPGHTAGSCCFYIPEEKVLFAGDTLFCGSYGRTDFPTSDPAAMQESIARLLTELPEDVTVLPGHDSFTNIEFERQHNPLRPRG